jgi:hypothetical protein
VECEGGGEGSVWYQGGAGGRRRQGDSLHFLSTVSHFCLKHRGNALKPLRIRGTVLAKIRPALITTKSTQEARYR